MWQITHTSPHYVGITTSIYYNNPILSRQATRSQKTTGKMYDDSEVHACKIFPVIFTITMDIYQNEEIVKKNQKATISKVS
jgi:hypothetical protein